MIRINHLGKHVRRLWACDRGAVAPLVGFCAIALIGAVAVAVDIGRGQVAQSKLQASLDAAGLAAGAMVGQNLSEELLEPEAEKYLNVNFNGKTIDAAITDFDLDLSEDNSIVTLEAKASLPTTFMRIFGKDSMQVAARSEITRETTGLEVAVVLDVTGSMESAVGNGDSTQKIAALRTAAASLINILFGSNAEVDDLWVGIVPFSQSVNIGTDRTDWLSDYDTRSAQDNNVTGISTDTTPITLVDDWMYPVFSNHSWGGCVEERWTGNDVTDEPPSVEKWPTYFYPDTNNNTYTDDGNTYNTTNSWIGNSPGYSNRVVTEAETNSDANGSKDRWANRGCPRQAITTFTNVKQELLDAVAGLVDPQGNTHINVGAVWGWRLLSPKWRGLWGGDMDANDLPLDYGEPLSQKAMILMTDGTNTMTGGNINQQSIYTAYGHMAWSRLGTTSNSSTAVAALNAKTIAVCNAMKAQGVLIYTIVFGNGSSTSAKNLMKNCASETDYYFFSPSTENLQAAFQAIGDSLSKLRISK